MPRTSDLTRRSLTSVAVYCGSSPGISIDYANAARGLAEALFEADIALVYGGASKGTMGVIADHILALGGSVTGVIPQSLVDKEVAHHGLSELIITDSMHERKALMVSMCDGFIALPGGTGTLEEIVETLTWAQLQFHDKPCGLLNVQGYYDHLLAFLDHAEAQEFLRSGHRRMLQVDNDPRRLLRKFSDYRLESVQKWVD